MLFVFAAEDPTKIVWKMSFKYGDSEANHIEVWSHYTRMTTSFLKSFLSSKCRPYTFYHLNVILINSRWKHRTPFIKINLLRYRWCFAVVFHPVTFNGISHHKDRDYLFFFSLSLSLSVSFAIRIRELLPPTSAYLPLENSRLFLASLLLSPPRV